VDAGQSASRRAPFRYSGVVETAHVRDQHVGRHEIVRRAARHQRNRLPQREREHRVGVGRVLRQRTQPRLGLPGVADHLAHARADRRRTECPSGVHNAETLVVACLNVAFVQRDGTDRDQRSVRRPVDATQVAVHGGIEHAQRDVVQRRIPGARDVPSSTDNGSTVRARWSARCGSARSSASVAP
jgi:hypothetical protein